jgi:hypothetical protein
MTDYDELAAYWPDMAALPDGVDVFEAQYGRPSGEVVVSDRLLAVETMALALAEQMRDGTHAERKARGLLLALATAIHNDSLDSLVEHLKPWMCQEAERVLPPQPEPQPTSEGDNVSPFTAFASFDVEG